MQYFSGGAVLALAFGASCHGSVGGEPPCADPECPEDAVEVVNGCNTDDCFTVEACGSSVECVPASSCAMTCLFEEIAVASCTQFMDNGFNCRSFESCGRVVHCAAKASCSALPFCDEGDEKQISGYCPERATCYEVELCDIRILCLDGSAGAGGAGGGGGSG